MGCWVEKDCGTDEVVDAGTIATVTFCRGWEVDPKEVVVLLDTEFTVTIELGPTTAADVLVVVLLLCVKIGLPPLSPIESLPQPLTFPPPLRPMKLPQPPRSPPPLPPPSPNPLCNGRTGLFAFPPPPPC